MKHIDLTARLPGRSAQLAERTNPVRVQVDSTWLQSLSTWSVASVRCALDEHESGVFARSALLADAVIRDPQVFAHLMTRVSALSARSGLPFGIESDSVDDRSESVRRRVEQLWWTSCPEPEVAALQRDAVLLGVAVGRVEWTRKGSEWIPQLRRLRPSGLRWVEHEHTFRYIDGSGKDHVVTPGENGWVLHAPFGPDSWMQGAIRSLGVPWFARVCSLRDWLRFSERHAMPALVVEERFAQTDDVEGEDGDGADEFYSQFANLGRNPVIRVPQGLTHDEPKASVKWLELTSTSYDGFEALLRELRREIISTLLGRDPESSATNVGGDGAAVLERVRTEYLVADAEALSTTLRNQVWVPYVVYNVSPDLSELAPWPRWQTRPATDLAQRASTLNTAADALQKLIALGVDITPVLDELHLTRTAAPQPAPQDTAA